LNFCPSCSQKIISGAKFCIKCGIDISNLAVEEMSTDADSKQDRGNPKINSKSFMGNLVKGSLILLVILGVGGLSLWTYQSQKAISLPMSVQITSEDDLTFNPDCTLKSTSNSQPTVKLTLRALDERKEPTREPIVQEMSGTWERVKDGLCSFNTDLVYKKQYTNYQVNLVAGESEQLIGLGAIPNNVPSLSISKDITVFRTITGTLVLQDTFSAIVANNCITSYLSSGVCGSIRLANSLFDQGPNGERWKCQGTGKNAAIGPGAKIKISQAGKTLSESTMDTGFTDIKKNVVNSASRSITIECNFYFTIKVPSRELYEMNIGTSRPFSLIRSKLEKDNWQVKFLIS